MRIVRGREAFTGKWIDRTYTIICADRPNQGPYNTLSEAKASARLILDRKVKWIKRVRKNGILSRTEYYFEES